MQNLLEILNNPVILTAITGVIVSVIIQILKKWADVQGSTWPVRILVAVFSLATTIVLQTTGHSIFDPGLWTGIVQTALLYLSAHLTHASVLRDPNKV